MSVTTSGEAWYVEHVHCVFQLFSCLAIVSTAARNIRVRVFEYLCSLLLHI